MTDLGGGGGRRGQVRVREQRAPGWGGGGGDGGGARWAVGFGEDYRVFKFPLKSLKFYVLCHRGFQWAAHRKLLASFH